MRYLIWLLVGFLIVPISVTADVIKYKATGPVTWSSDESIVAVDETFVFLFTLDTNATKVLEDEEINFYKQEYPLNLNFSRGFSVYAKPKTSEDNWQGREQHRIVSYDDFDNQVFAAHESGNNSGDGGHDFLFNEVLSNGWVDFIFGFYEMGPPFEITSLDLVKLPSLDDFDEAGFLFTSGDIDVNGDFDSLSEIPRLTCEGFLPPLDRYPVEVKKNRVLPLRIHLRDEDGFEVTNTDLPLPISPAIVITYEPNVGAESIDVTDDALSVGQVTEGNQFTFTDEGYWQYNLKVKNYSSAGLYTIRVYSTDEATYFIHPTCESSFVID
jgi:hypothetical protein